MTGFLRSARARLANSTARFSRSEDGNSTVEFIVVFPVFVTMLMSGIEMGAFGISGSILERGLELAVRDVRLGIVNDVGPEDFKTMVCDYAGLLRDCQENIRIEMTRVSPADWAVPNNYGSCVDRAAETQADVSFENGNENELMVVRACLLIDPIFPTSGIGKQLETDEGMGYGIYSTTTFVNEPNT